MDPIVQDSLIKNEGQIGDKVPFQAFVLQGV